MQTHPSPGEADRALPRRLSCPVDEQSPAEHAVLLTSARPALPFSSETTLQDAEGPAARSGHMHRPGTGSARIGAPVAIGAGR